jgi:excinuclease ABC subunit A
LYILDEPTIGLHFRDVEALLQVLQRLVDAGNTVVIIEHNLDVIQASDWIIDLGPEGGDKGGRIIFEGTPEKIINVKESYTGKYLKEHIYTHSP